MAVLTDGTTAADTVVTRPTTNTSSSKVKPAVRMFTPREKARPMTAGPFRLLLSVLGFADGDLRFQLQKTLLADALHVHQFLDLLERPLLLPVFDDASRRRGADAGQLFELRRRRGVQIDDRRGRSRAGFGACRRRGLRLRLGLRRREQGERRERQNDSSHRSLLERMWRP